MTLLGMTSEKPTVVIDRVSRTFGGGASAVPAVNDVSFELERGSFVTLVGASGSGKSSLLNIIGTLDRPDSGRVLVDGMNLSSSMTTRAPASAATASASCSSSSTCCRP